MNVSAFVLILGGALFALFPALTWRKVARLERTGVRVTGVVTWADPLRTPSEPSEMQVRFTTLDGRDRLTHFDVLPEDRLPIVGDEVRLVYDPKDPRRTRLVHARSANPAATLLTPIAIGAVAIVAGVVVAVVQLLG
ncbi:hypothetical protein GCM10025792_41390 [Pseudonocardia tropica]